MWYKSDDERVIIWQVILLLQYSGYYVQNVIKIFANLVLKEFVPFLAASLHSQMFVQISRSHGGMVIKGSDLMCLILFSRNYHISAPSLQSFCLH